MGHPMAHSGGHSGGTQGEVVIVRSQDEREARESTGSKLAENSHATDQSSLLRVP